MTIRNRIIKKAIAQQERLDEIRNDPNLFRENVIIDDKTGEFIRQEKLHRSWMDHVKLCKQKKKHCAILAPWGHGKSVQIAIAESLYLIGHNHEIRMKIINSLDMYAIDRVKAIKNYIERDERYKRLFPNVEKDEDQEWTAHRIYIKRKTRAIDPTIEARGITSTGIGGRVDVLIFDDPVDENSISSEKVRETVRNKYQNLWMGRLIPGGFVYYIATRWHDEDLTRTIIESGEYLVLIQRISDDFKRIEQEII